jgi:hypothetical protein
VRQFHACYSVGDDRLWGVVKPRKGADNSLQAIKSCRASRSDGERKILSPPVMSLLRNGASTVGGRRIAALAEDL